MVVVGGETGRVARVEVVEGSHGGRLTASNELLVHHVLAAVVKVLVGDEGCVARVEFTANTVDAVAFLDVVHEICIVNVVFDVIVVVHATTDLEVSRGVVVG